MLEYRTILNENGRIIIPAALRKQLHLQSGEELVIRVENDELHIFSVHHALKKAQAVVRKFAKNKDLVKKLKSMRKEDSHHE
jgi:AbrB family looped-hinge helix DNA binding protein